MFDNKEFFGQINFSHSFKNYMENTERIVDLPGCRMEIRQNIVLKNKANRGITKPIMI